MFRWPRRARRQPAGRPAPRASSSAAHARTARLATPPARLGRRRWLPRSGRRVQHPPPDEISEVAHVGIGRRPWCVLDQRDRTVNLAGPKEKRRAPHSRLELGLRKLHGRFVPAYDVGGLGLAWARARQPLLLGDERIGEMEPRLVRTTQQRPSYESRRESGSRQAFEGGHLGPEPCALESVGAVGMPDARTVFGQQPVSLIACEAVVAAKSRNGQLRARTRRRGVVPRARAHRTHGTRGSRTPDPLPQSTVAAAHCSHRVRRHQQKAGRRWPARAEAVELLKVSGVTPASGKTPPWPASRRPTVSASQSIGGCARWHCDNRPLPLFREYGRCGRLRPARRRGGSTTRSR